MPGLLELKTDLKSLKYGHDRPDWGSSGQPYIQTDINIVDSGFNQFRLTTFDDGLVRGGVIGAANAAIVDTLRISKFLYTDIKGPLFIVKQIGLQLSNPRLEVPRNLLNIAQGGLDNILSATTNGLLEPTRIYNLGINTLAQVPFNAIGGHFNRHGLLPVQNEASKYEAVVTANNNDQFTSAIVGAVTGINIPNNPSKNNRLIKLVSELGLKDNFKFTPFPNKSRAAQSSAIQLSFLNQILSGVTVKNIPKNKIQLGGTIPSLSYFGGPGSTYGIGYTNIKRSTITQNSKTQPLEDAKTFTSNLTRISTDDSTQKITAADIGLSALDPRVSQFSDPGNAKYDSGNASSIRDFTAINYSDVQPSLRKYSELLEATQKIISGSYNKRSLNGLINTDNLFEQNKTNNERSSKGETTLRNLTSTGYSTSTLDEIVYYNGIRDTNSKNPLDSEKVVIKTGGSWNTVSRENRVGSGRQDAINLTPIFPETSYWAENFITIKGKDFNIRDLAKFIIQAVDTDSPTDSNFMMFRAYITSFTDNVDASWNPVKYAGRGDKFYIYDGFDRKISISFKVAALSAAEMKPMYQKLNYLMSNLMPDYKGVLMRGPLMRMTVGNYFDAQLGVLTSLSYTVPNDSPWEIALDEPTAGGTAQLILPHIIEVSLGFTPIGSETGVSTNGTGSVSNELPRKSDKVSNLAQNTTGKDVGTLQYIE